MSSTVIFVFCAQALLCQFTFGQLQPNLGGNAATGALGLASGLVKPGNGFGLAGNGLGLAGNGLGLARNGLGLTGNGLGLAGNGFGLGGNALGVAENVLGLAENGLSFAGNEFGLAENVAFGGEGFLNVASISGTGVLPIASYSPIVPGGLTVVSNNGIEGGIVVNGDVPFLSAVAFEGSVISDGAGATNCGCGNGEIGIVKESVAPVAGTAGIGNGLGVSNGLGSSLGAGVGAGLGTGLGRLGGNIAGAGLGNRGLGGRLY